MQSNIMAHIPKCDDDEATTQIAAVDKVQSGVLMRIEDGGGADGVDESGGLSLPESGTFCPHCKIFRC